jgi:hypothetical protein
MGKYLEIAILIAIIISTIIIISILYHICNTPNNTNNISNTSNTTPQINPSEFCLDKWKKGNETINFRYNKFEVNSTIGTAGLVVIDQCANKDPTKRENVTVTVDSTTDPVGIRFNLDEHGKNSAEFIDHPLDLLLNSIKSDKSIGALKVSPGDTITATYDGIKARAYIISPTIPTKIVGVSALPSNNPINQYDNYGSLMDNGVRPDLTATLSCLDESDNDGICDEWKDPTNSNYLGSNGQGLAIPYGSTIYQLNCDPTIPNDCPGVGMKDLYVEIAYMYKPADLNGKNAISQRPSTVALDLVKSSMLVHGIRLHYYIDDNEFGQPPGTGLNFYRNTITVPGNINDDPITTNPSSFFSIKNAYFGDANDRDSSKIPNGIPQEWLTAKRQVFHYALFVHDIADHVGTSGWAEIFGNDMIISLGQFSNSGQGSDAEIAGTFMHELGHNLNLGHGGAPSDITNCKPNHRSVMSYQYQFPYFAFNPSNWASFLDYSSGNSIQLNEKSLDENAGVGSAVSNSIVFGVTPMATLNPSNPVPPSYLQYGPPNAGGGPNSIDWDGSKRISSAVSSEINNIGIPECNENDLTILNDYNDWNNLNFEFRNSVAFQNGATVFNSNMGEEMSRGDVDKLIYLEYNHVNSTGHDLFKGFNVTGNQKFNFT